MKQFYLLLFAVSVFFFIRNLLLIAFHMENIKVHKKRLKQLKFEQQQKRDKTEVILDRLTKPIIEVIFPKLNIFDFEVVAKELRFAKWKLSPERFVALKLLGKVLGVVLFLLFRSVEDGTALGAFWGSILFFLPQILLSNSAKNRREAILMEFPDFIRITQGYLTANLTFERAVKEAAPFLSEDWQEILRGFSSKANFSLDSALEYLKDEVGTIEVREFISIVRLTLEQGGRARESFEAQAEKIQQMLYDMMLVKIGRRKMYGTLIQAPLLLANMAILGLPVVYSFSNMGF